MKMDAVPGIPTTMWFTPKFTTKQMKEKYGQDFNYEISCDQMCGSGHYTMRGTVVVETQGEFNVWLAQQQPQYDKVHSAPEVPAKPAGTADSTNRVALNN
jgi:cytochrome c oxidase subunit 2